MVGKEKKKKKKKGAESLQRKQDVGCPSAQCLLCMLSVCVSMVVSTFRSHTSFRVA